MATALVLSRARCDIRAPLVTIEIHHTGGLPSLAIVGMPETAVRESKDRVRSAIINSGFEFPRRRITVNLAPADLPKEGGRFDLGIALGILVASEQLPADCLQGMEFLGELGLRGDLRPVPGVLPAALQCRDAGATLLVPEQNAEEAALIQDLDLLAANNLLAVCGHLVGSQPLPRYQRQASADAPPQGPDLAEVHSQQGAKRALEIAAAGGHSLLMVGPPGSGKTMLAERLPGLLPEMDEQAALESAAVHSVSGDGLNPATWLRRPWRAPHHTASAVALVGGGSNPRPGEISLAHNGVLFLDELPEFDRRVLEVLREPLESGQITISRAARQAQFPARFQLVAAMNPCPCGYLGDPDHHCRCTAEQVQRYRARLSGPLLDRIDMHIVLPPVREAIMATGVQGESSQAVRNRVTRARDAQTRRGQLNHRLDQRGIERHCPLDEDSQTVLRRALRQLGLSARAYHRVLRVARTIADLEQSDGILKHHVAEAIQYRQLDRHSG